MIPTPINAPAAQPLLMSVNEVATALGCGRDTVYRLMTSGQLPSVIVGGRLRRVRQDDLRTYVDSLTATRPAR